MDTLTKNIKYYSTILAIAILLTGCGNDDDSIGVIKIDYPFGIDDLSKFLKQKIDFASTTNPDTITYQYNNEKRITSLTSSRNRYLVEYQYAYDNSLIHSKTTNAINNSVTFERDYTYSNIDNLTIVTQSNGVIIDSTLWKLSGVKGIESTSYSKKGGRNLVAKSIYTWNNENIEKYEIYEQIDIETSFNNLESFPDALEKTIANISNHYNLELIEDGSDYYLVQRTKYESYNEGINILRYLSNMVPITESQKIYEIQHTNLYDQERRTYFENTGYTTFTIDDKGYPIRLATGGSNARKLDFIYK